MEISDGRSPMTTGTLAPPRSLAAAGAADGRRWPQSDEDMYLAVTRAWCRMLSREERRKRPLGPHVFGGGFARSVANAPIDGLLVASICAQLACRHMWQRGAGESLPLDRPPHEALDPAAAWWRALERSDGIGVHYAELGGGTLEFLSVARQNDRPDLS